MSPLSARVARFSAAFPQRPTASASSMASAALFSPLRRPSVRSASHTSAAYAMLLRSITASAPQTAIFSVSPRDGLSWISFRSASVSAKKPPNSTSFVAFTAITMFSG